MGAYLSEPVTDKVSTDEKCERLCYGASSMQGWRVTQEDAHNCIPNYDENSSFFAVYDGHGGAEVAKYCSIHLPNFLRSLPQYKENKLMKSLETAFIDFDSLLIKPEVITELKQLAGVGDASESEEDETEVLNEEAEMPLDELLARYKSGSLPLKTSPHLEHLHNDKPKSPMLRAKKDERLQTPIKIFSKKNMKEKHGKNEDIIVNGENESKLDNESQPVVNAKEKTQELEKKTDDKMGKGDSLEKQQLNDDHFVSDCGKGDAGTNGDSSNTNKEQSDQGEGDKVDINLDKESASTSSTRKRKGGPLLDLEDSDTSDDDYGESGSSSEEFNEEWDKLDEEDDDDDEEEEEDDDDDDEDDDDEDEDEQQRGGHELFSMGEKEEPGSDSGCTAVVAVIRGNKLYVANAGDSRCVVSRGGKALDMSCDHKPEDETERTRIEKAGGQVTGDGRVNGGLNLSRAIGDHSYKQNANLSPEEQMITALPDVRMLTLDATDNFMVLACDGIWNYMSSQEVVDFIRKRLDSTEKLSTICEELFDNCLSPNTLGDGTGCDNMTCIIVKLHNIRSPDSNVSIAKRPHSPVESSPEIGKKRKVNVDSS